MTKRISVNNATHAKVAVDANAVEAALAAAHVVTPAHVDAEAHAGKAPMADVDVAAKTVADSIEADAVHAAPVELAMVAAGDAAPAVFAAGQDDTSTDAAPAEDVGGEGGDNTGLYVGGGLLAAAVVGAVVVGGTSDEAEEHAGDPPPPPPNEAPEFDGASQAVSGDEDTAITVTAVATDADGDDLTYTVGDAAHGTVTAGEEDGTFLYKPDADYNGTDSFTVTVSDGTDEATQTINVTVNPVDDDAPAFAADTATATVAENSDVATAVYTAQATDPDAGDTVTYSLTGDDAAAFTIDGETGEIHFVASPDFEAQESYDVTVVATDSDDHTDSLALTVNVTDVDDTVTMNLDTDSDTSINTPTSFDAADGDVIFTDDGNVASNVEIDGFGQGDTIVASNVDEGEQYSFTSTATDIVISFVGDANATNQITIHDVVTADAVVTDEASAEAAVGFDFFQYA